MRKHLTVDQRYAIDAMPVYRDRHRGMEKDSRGIIRGRVDISQREAVVERKERMGDLEIDAIAGKGHKEATVRINDRATGYL